MTSPVEWRRRAGSVDAPPRPPSGGTTEMARLVDEAWDELDGAAAARLRELVWDQPDDVAGVRTGRDPDTYVMAHAGPQEGFATLGWATAFLALRFEAEGDDDDLAAAIELHDLTAALGDDVWTSTANAPVALGAALLYGITGEEAFLATAERLCDLLCEVPPLSEEGAAVLRACAEVVEPRQAAEPAQAQAEAEAQAQAQAQAQADG